MKKALLFAFCFLNCIFARAQEAKRYPLDFGDVFILRIKFEGILFADKCYCDSKDKCILSKVKINVIYCSPSKNYDSTRISNIEYMIFKKSDKKYFKKNIFYSISAKPSGSNYYLSFSRIINLDSSKSYVFYHPYAYLSEVNLCEQGNKFNSYIMRNNR